MDELSKILKNLSDYSPIFGKGRRKKAIKELSKIGTAEVVPYLIKGLSDPDIDIKKAAFLELSRLKDENAINYLCSLYLKDKNEKIWEIIINRGFIPSLPKERLIFLIKTGQTRKCIPPTQKDIPLLIEMLKDEELKKDALRILSSINDNALRESLFDTFFLNFSPHLLKFLINTEWLPQDEGKKLIFYLLLKRNEDALFIEKRKAGTFINFYKNLKKNGKEIIISLLFKSKELESLLYPLIAFENDLEILILIFKELIKDNRKEALLFFIQEKDEEFIINIISSLSLSDENLLEIGLEKGGLTLCMVYTSLKKKGWKPDSEILSEFMEDVGRIKDEILRINIDTLSSYSLSILSKIKDEDVIDKLIPLLKSKTGRIKRMVSNCLIAISGNRVINALTELFKEEDWALRVICAETLGRMGKEKVIEFLEKAVLEEKWGVSKEAFISLAKLSPPSSSNIFINALRPPNPKIKRIASSSLGKIGNEGAIKPLIRALDDKDEIVRLHAAHSIANISKRYNLPLSLGIKSLHGKQGIIKAMGLIRDKRYINFLLPFLNDGDWKIRKEAIKSLGMIGDREAINPLIKMLQDEKLEVKRETAKALCKLGEEKGLGILIDGIRSKNWITQMEMAYTISNYVIENRERALKVLAELTKDQNPQNRLAGIIGLGMTKDEKFVPILLMAWAQEREIGIKKRIITSLINIGSQKGQRAFILGLADKEQEIRVHSIEAFGKLKVKEGFPILLEKMDSFDEKEKKAIFFSLRQLIDKFGKELSPKNLALLEKKIKELEVKETETKTELLLLELSLSLLKYKKKKEKV